MDIIDYTKLYDNVIKVFAGELMEIDRIHFGKDDSVALKINESNKNKIHKFYEEKRLEVREKYMSSSDMAMDRHKIGSAMIYAILHADLLLVDTNIPNLPDELVMANEYIAIYTAISIVEMYRYDDYISKNHLAKYTVISEDLYKLILPDTYHEKEEQREPCYIKSNFINNTCKALYYARNISGMKNFDLFAYANILFLLEKYTDDLKSIQLTAEGSI